MKKIIFIASLTSLSLIAMAQVRVSEPKSHKEVLNEQYSTGLFRSADGIIIDIANENVQSYFNILDWLDGRVAGLQVFTTRGGVRIPVIRGSLATIFVDEMRLDPSYLNTLSVNDIAMIKVIKGPFAGAFGNGGGGTIAIYTLKGEDEEDEED